ncbi:hypothetical protein ACIQ8G_35390 [Streptomyces sp. NPDC094154]|uniref:hypothetical protein n=1 Tax=Streptomyces sp. NPDC094154 TaxID=3366059 RepID=UPI00381C1E51
MEAVSDLLTLRTDYTAKIDADLELVEKDRERVRSEITALQDQLHTLEDNHALLLSMRAALSDDYRAACPEPGTDGTATAAGSSPVAPPVSDAVPLTGGGAAAGHGQATAAPKETPAAAKKAPTLRDLVAGELKRRGEPCSSNDVATALARAHPGRRIKEPAMRHALEALVGQGRARRAKRGSRVFYLPASTSAGAGTAEDDGTGRD